MAGKGKEPHQLGDRKEEKARHLFGLTRSVRISLYYIYSGSKGTLVREERNLNLQEGKEGVHPKEVIYVREGF